MVLIDTREIGLDEKQRRHFKIAGMPRAAGNKRLKNLSFPTL